MSTREKTCPQCGTVLVVYQHFVDAPATRPRCPQCRFVFPPVDDRQRWCEVNQRFYTSGQQLQEDILQVGKRMGTQIFARGKVVRLEGEFGYIEPYEGGPIRRFAAAAAKGEIGNYQVGDLVSYEDRGHDQASKIHHTPTED